MEYTIKQLADMAGISTRTLRYYDEIGLLKPSRVNDVSYRIYTKDEVDLLQQILLYRQMGFELCTIQKVIYAPNYNKLSALKKHLDALYVQKEQLTTLIQTVTSTIEAEEGINKMQDSEKFEGLKQQIVAENETKYGTEIREKYGDTAVENTHEKLLHLSKEQYNAMQSLASDINSKLEQAVASGATASSALAKEIVTMHKQWLCYSLKEYHVHIHQSLAQMYVQDKRFTAYYDRTTKGCAAFLCDAITHWAESI